MANVCLPLEQAKKFIQALKSGEIQPTKLAEMTSADRTAFFEKIVGEDGKMVNALFESKLLLKNQQAGLISWAKTVTGISEPAKRDIISRIEKMDKILNPGEEEAFLAALAEKKLGIEITYAEAQQISNMAKSVGELKNQAIEVVERPGYKLKKESRADFETRMKYGFSLVDFKDYIASLKPESKITLRDFVSSPIKNIGGLFKSLVSSLDNSFFGNQGIAALLDPKTSDIWGKAFAKSFGDIAKNLAGGDALRAIRAEAYSRPGALSGRYAKEKLSIDLNTEEAFPIELPRRIPVLSRLYKASSEAYNGAALRLRVDISDRIAAMAEKNGVDITNPKTAEARGRMINSMTGRGHLGVFEPAASHINVLVFSGKLIKGAVDTLTAGLTDPKIRKDPFARKQAAYKLIRMAGTVQAISFLSNLLNPGSAETDPRGAHWGQIKIGDTWFNYVGPFRPIVRTAARALPTMHDGELGFWEKDKHGKWTNLAHGKFGRRNALDMVEEFFENKASPMLSVILTHWRGRTFSGDEPTLKSDAINLATPISIQNYLEGRGDEETDKLIFRTLIDGLGFSTTPEKKK